MTKESFVALIENHPYLKFLVPPKDGVYKIVNNKLQVFEVYDKDIEGNWAEWEMVLMGNRKPQIMEHFTRICGYYADLNNWNRSKIAELKDRQKGNYSVQ